MDKVENSTPKNGNTFERRENVAVEAEGGEAEAAGRNAAVKRAGGGGEARKKV